MATAHGIVTSKMASGGKDAKEDALELIRELEIGDGVQEQLYIDAQKSRVDELETELKELVETNRDIEELNAKLARKVQMVKDNYGRLIAGLERFRQQQLSRQS